MRQKISYEYRFVLDLDYRGKDVSNEDLPNQIVQLGETPRIGESYMIDARLFEVVGVKKAIILSRRNQNITGVESKLVNVLIRPIPTAYG